VLFPIEGALSGIILGGGRLPQLCVLFVAFCVFQVAAFTAAWIVWKSRVYGYITLGLIHTQVTPWFQQAGGLFDFRMDFFAYCLYGLWVSVALRSQLFLDPYWSIGCDLIGVFLVLNRFVTLAYLLGVSAGFAIVCAAIAIFWRSDPELAFRMRRRLLHLGLSTGLLILVVAPILIRNWESIHGYYRFLKCTQVWGLGSDFGVPGRRQQGSIGILPVGPLLRGQREYRLEAYATVNPKPLQSMSGHIDWSHGDKCIRVQGEMPCTDRPGTSGRRSNSYSQTGENCR
jgi:hypothetical protein